MTLLTQDRGTLVENGNKCNKSGRKARKKKKKLNREEGGGGRRKMISSNGGKAPQK